jgi:dUTP pyrophosphatase
MHRRKVNELAVIKVNSNAYLPVIKTSGSAGYDLCSCEDGVVLPRKRELIGTGLTIKIPAGYCGQIWPRSGFSVKYGIETGAGVIDSDYGGVIKVVLHNHSDSAFEYKRGMRIAQLLIIPVITPPVVEYNVVNFKPVAGTRRGGFGSTGEY